MVLSVARENTPLVAEGGEPKSCSQALCRGAWKIASAIGCFFRCICPCSCKREEEYGGLPESGAIVLDGAGTMVLEGKRISLRSNNIVDSDDDGSNVSEPPPSTRSSWKESYRKPTIRPKTPTTVSRGTTVEGTSRLSSRERSAAPSVILKAILTLWPILLEKKEIDSSTLDRILQEGLDAYRKQPASFDEQLLTYKNLQEVNLSVSRTDFTTPRSPTLCYEDEEKKEPPFANEYLSELELLATTLQAKKGGLPLISAVFFKGNQENVKAYGIFVCGDRFYLLNPYGRKERGITCHQFPGPGMFSDYLRVIEPAPFDRPDINQYWIRPFFYGD